MRITEDADIGALTTFQVGGRARVLIELEKIDELPDALRYLHDRQLSWWLLGEGSNVVVDDGHLEGAVVRILDDTLEVETFEEGIALYAAAGANWDDLVARSVEAGAGGVECMSGIPGSCGAAPVQNIGAYGQELADTLVSVDIFDLYTMRFGRLAAEACGFGYRTSHFKGQWRGRYIVTGIHLALPTRDTGLTTYGDLSRHFATSAHAPSVKEVRDAVLQIRSEKAMVRDARRADCRSAGSFFTNPHLDEREFAALRAQPAAAGRFIPSFPVGERIKVPAAWLIEHAGTQRGEAEGGAAISSRHVLALTNRNNATCEDVLTLASRVRERVARCWGIELEMEPRRITPESAWPPPVQINDSSEGR